MAHQFTRPNVNEAATAQQAYDEAHAYLTHLLGRIQARHAGIAHLSTTDWGHAGTLQHHIELAQQLLDASGARF